MLSVCPSLACVGDQRLPRLKSTDFKSYRGFPVVRTALQMHEVSETHVLAVAIEQQDNVQ